MLGVPVRACAQAQAGVYDVCVHGGWRPTVDIGYLLQSLPALML